MSVRRTLDPVLRRVSFEREQSDDRIAAFAQTIDTRVVLEEPPEESVQGERPTDHPSTDASEVLARVSRLERAVTRVLEMLRRRSG